MMSHCGRHSPLYVRSPCNQTFSFFFFFLVYLHDQLRTADCLLFRISTVTRRDARTSPSRGPSGGDAGACAVRQKFGAQKSPHVPVTENFVVRDSIRREHWHKRASSAKIINYFSSKISNYMSRELLKLSKHQAPKFWFRISGKSTYMF